MMEKNNHTVEQLVYDPLAREIYGRPYCNLNCDEKYHIRTDALGLNDNTSDSVI